MDQNNQLIKLRREKYEKIKESILTEIINGFYNTTIEKSEVERGLSRTVTLTKKYIDAMTERQKKLFSPALRMAAFLNDTRLDKFKVTPEFKAVFEPERLNTPFAVQEEAIKNKLKQLMLKNV